MIKILILQTMTDQIQVEDQKEVYEILDKKAKDISRSHKKRDLVEEFAKIYPDIDIYKFSNVLDKLEEYYFRRYVVPTSSSIELQMLESIDELYFLLRDNIVSDVGRGIIDEIHMQRELKWGHPIQAFGTAYLYNRHFRPHKHPSYSIIGPDLKSYYVKDGISYLEGEPLPKSLEKWLKDYYSSRAINPKNKRLEENGNEI